MNTANKITIVRIILVPVFMIVLLLDGKHTNFIALAIFILASATDGIDGHIARKYNQITNFGKFIDPLADKLLVTAAPVSYTHLDVYKRQTLVIACAAAFLHPREEEEDYGA